MTLKIRTVLLVMIQILIVKTFKIMNSWTTVGDADARMICKADSSWEFCVWTRLDTGDTCNLEWKRAQAGVVIDTCSPDLVTRVDIGGSYGEHQCGIVLHNISREDAGNWTCEMEEYQFGDWVSGAREVATLELIFDEDEVEPDAENEVTTEEKDNAVSTTEYYSSVPQLHDDQDAMDNIIGFLNLSLSRNIVLDVTDQDQQDQGFGEMLGISAAVIILVSLVGMTVIVWYRKMHGNVDFQKFVDSDWLKAKEMVENIPVTMSELMEVEK